MTLCVAWKWAPQNGEAHIYFAADTCVTLQQEEMPYGGIKIAALPVQYRAPQSQANNRPPSIKVVYGFAFSGEYLAAFLVRELTSQVLIHLQGIHAPSELKFDKVCSIVVTLYSRLRSQIHDTFRRGEAVEFFFGGYCPASGHVRVAKFFFDETAGAVAHTEILTRQVGESFEVIGTGAAKARFRELVELSLSAPPCRVHFTMFRRLRDVILDPDIPSVGGAIQCGEFAPGSRDFEILGSGITDVWSSRLRNRNFLGGMDLDELRQSDPFGLHIHPTITLPFNEDLATFSGRSHWSNKGRSVSLDEIITVLPHDLRWGPSFREAEKILRRIFGRAVEIEHIGSTAVPGLPAVPTIDILIASEPLQEGDPRAERLASLGFEYLGFTRNEFRPLLRARGERNLSLFFATPNSHWWREAVTLREFLRANADARTEFATAKLGILNLKAGTLCRYNELKNSILDALQSRAPSVLPKKRRKFRWF